VIKIIDYRAGNAPSVLHAVRQIGLEAELVSSGKALGGASCIILPGVGSAKATMDSLAEMQMLPVLEKMVMQEKVTFLGICVGLQILFDFSEEDDCRGLGWFKGRVVRFDNTQVRVPQMGWNEVSFTSGSENGFFYFVNSYHAVAENPADVWAVADYGGDFTAAIHRENIFATQFHIEKSGEAGLSLLKKILEGNKC